VDNGRHARSSDRIEAASTVRRSLESTPTGD
jgi:hypothetical protein